MNKTKDNSKCGKNCNCNSNKPDTSGGSVSGDNRGKGGNCGVTINPPYKDINCGVTSNQPYNNTCDVNRPFNNQYAPTGMENADQADLETNINDKAKAKRADRTATKD